MRLRSSAIAVVVAGATLLGASPALAKPLITPGWSPVDPPADRKAFEAGLAAAIYSVDCGGVVGTGWSADVADDTNFLAALVTTSAVGTACRESAQSPGVRQGDQTYPALPWNSAPAIGLGLVALVPDRPYLDWDYVPMPRVDQWVAIQGSAADGAPLLPLLKRRIVAVDVEAATFTLDAPVGAEYAGAPVVDNRLRALGVLASPGTTVTGSPQMCDELFICVEPGRVWWDITAPSAPSSTRVVAGKGSVTFSWTPVSSDGGAEVSYWYRVGAGGWQKADAFRVKVKARKGTVVRFALNTINEAGPGPTITLTGRAR